MASKLPAAWMSQLRHQALKNKLRGAKGQNYVNATAAIIEKRDTAKDRKRVSPVGNN